MEAHQTKKKSVRPKFPFTQIQINAEKTDVYCSCKYFKNNIKEAKSISLKCCQDNFNKAKVPPWAKKITHALTPDEILHCPVDIAKMSLGKPALEELDFSQGVEIYPRRLTLHTILCISNE